jgi:hypothetical protein
VIASEGPPGTDETSGNGFCFRAGEGACEIISAEAIEGFGLFESIQITKSDAAIKTGNEATALKMLATEILGSMVESYRFCQRKRKLRAEHRLKTRLKFRF